MKPIKRAKHEMQSNGAATQYGTPNAGRNATQFPATPNASRFSRDRDENRNLISADLPADEQLVNTREFPITESRNGKVITCGEKVHVYPTRSEFRIRILNTDFNNGGILRNYIEFSMPSFNILERHTSEIERIANDVLKHRYEILHLSDLSSDLGVTISPDRGSGGNIIEMRTNNNCFSQIKLSTFKRIIQCKKEIDSEYHKFVAKEKIEQEIYKSLINMFAYRANNENSNTSVKEPSTINRTAIMKTIDKLWQQMERVVKKENALSN